MAKFPLETGTEGLRKEVIDSAVKQTAARAYKFRQALAVVPTSAWSNTFTREDLTVLTAKGNRTIKGIPRGANFPQARPDFQDVTNRIVKFGLEDNINWEDQL